MQTKSPLSYPIGEIASGSRGARVGRLQTQDAADIKQPGRSQRQTPTACVRTRDALSSFSHNSEKTIPVTVTNTRYRLSSLRLREQIEKMSIP